MSKIYSNKLFHISGCLQRQSVFDFVHGKLSDFERTQVREHLAECEFCRDAIEGCQELSESELKSGFKRLDRRMDILLKEKTLAVGPNFKRPNNKVYYTLAASIALLIGSILFFRMYQRIVKDDEVYVAELISQPKAAGVITEDTTVVLAKHAQEKKYPENMSSAIRLTPAPTIINDQLIVDEADVAIPILNETKSDKKVMAQPAAESIIAQSGEHKVLSNLAIISNESNRSSSKKIKSAGDQIAKDEKGGAASNSLVEPLSYVQEDAVEEEIFVVAEKSAIFPGGPLKLQKFIEDNIRYPEAALEQNISGTVYVKFVIEKDGGIDLPQVVKGVDSLLDQEALRIVNTLPHFIPAEQHGKAVRMWYSLPIRFSLLR